VSPAELAGRDSSDFVRVLFQLDSMTVDDAAEEMKPLLSLNGTLKALKGTNRLEAMDAVANLREIAAFLHQEQSANAIKRPFKEIPLNHVRAEDVRKQLIDLLDLDKDGGGKTPPIPPGMNPEQARQMMEAQKQAGGQGQPKPPGAPSAAPAVSLVVNARKNSLIVNAPPAKMAMIEQAITILDVPSDVSANLLSDVPYMQLYRIVGVDPQPVIKTLQEIGGLSPTAKLEIDKRGNIIAYAPLADHIIIRKLVERFSGTERKFEVIQLRHRQATDVAGTIMHMLGKEKKKENNRRGWGWGWDDYYSSRETDEKPDEFRVDADVETNQLLLWANEVELAEVNNLLRKLNEEPDKNQQGPLRVLDVGGSENAQLLLQRIRQMWPAANPLMESAAPESPAPENTPPDKPRKQPVAPPVENDSGIRSAAAHPWSSLTLLALADPQAQPQEGIPPAKENAIPKQAASPLAAGKPAQSPPISAPPKSAPPVKITISPSGQIIATSDDPKALDLFEDLAGQLAAPTKRSYDIIHLNYANAYNVSLILEDFFKEEAKQPKRRVPYWYEFENGGNDKEETALSLAKRPMLKFISDPDSNSILIHGADAKQMKQIKDLVTFYDKLPPKDDSMQRITKPIHLAHSKSKVVYETIKEVYRDLLSDKDKAFQGKQDNRSSFMDSYWVTEGEGDSQSTQRTPKFKGQLSIGLDELSNTLIVSAPKYLFDDVNKLIQALDEEAEPMADVQVVRLPNGIRGPELQKTLSDILAGKKSVAAAAADSQQTHQPRQHGKHSDSE
jgi:type II secretory pathway component GspD/PulD (secretin)